MRRELDVSWLAHAVCCVGTYARRASPVTRLRYVEVMSDPSITIAGEPFELLTERLSSMKVKQQPNGWYKLAGRIESPEVSAAWQRAIERYGADFIRPGNTDPLEACNADAFVRLVLDITDALGDGDDG
jgi:hypothetical protein